MGAVKNGPSNENQVDSKGQPALSSRLFGMAARDNSKNIPSRLIVRDAHLLTPESFFKDTAMLYTEAKTEVVIDRVTSAAMPRQMERIPVGSEFKLNLVLTLYTNDDEKEYVNGIFDALKLIEDDYLGGSGSRGYGQVKFTIENLTERDVKYYQSLGEERPFTAVPIPEQFKTKA
jgi:CRISPR-associated protein Csm3